MYIIIKINFVEKYYVKKLIKTLFLSELLSKGSSAANMKLDTIIHSRTTFPKYEWLHSQWQVFLNLEIWLNVQPVKTVFKLLRNINNCTTSDRGVSTLKFE